MIKTEWCGLPETKNQQGKFLTMYARSIWAYKKAEKWKKQWRQRWLKSEKAGIINRQ